jgi:multiple sugar transport system permease protein
VSAGLVLALTFNEPFKGVGIFKTAFFVPVVIPWAAAGVVWGYLLSTDTGIINMLLNQAGLRGVPWLSHPLMAMNTAVLVSGWKSVGYTTLILLGGLQSIDPVHYEVAYLNGASWWQKLRWITFPLLSPALFFVMVTEIINSFQIFDPIFVLTDGGPGTATVTIGYYIYQHAFKRFQFGYASTLSVFLLLVVMAFTLFQWWLQKRWVFYGK